MRTTVIRVADKQAKDKLLAYVYSYKHVENMLIILMQQNYELYREQKASDDFQYLSRYQVMRAVIRGTPGGKDREGADYIKEKYRDNSLMQELIAAGRKLKIHNLAMIFNRTKANYQGFFTKIKKGDSEAKPPKPKKLAKVTKYSIPLDVNAWSLERKDALGINLSAKMFYLPCNHEKLIAIVGSIAQIQAITIQMSNNDIYLLISYRYQRRPPEACLPAKNAGLDIGINNLASIVVADETTPSLIISGKQFKHYNATFNRLVAKISTTIADLRNQLKELGAAAAPNRLQYFLDFRRFLHEKRHRFFYDQFHKISKRILEYLSQQQVTDLYISKNLARLKTSGDCHLASSSKQSFIQIPFIKLLEYLEYKAADYGIRVHVVDESYTSKTSCISSDVTQIQAQAKENKPILTNDFKGSRVKRGLFKDTVLACVFNADLNAAVNIIKVGTHQAFDWLKHRLFKLCNPILLKCDWELVRLLRANTGSDKFTLRVSCL